MSPLKDSRNFPLMSVINGLLQSVGIVTMCIVIWTLAGFVNRIENVEKAQLEAKAASAEARAQNAKQYTDINDTLKAFPLATDQLARAVRDIQDLRDTDKQFDARVRGLESGQAILERDVRRLENPPTAPVRDSRR